MNDATLLSGRGTVDCSLDEDDDEEFLTECENVAKEFIKLQLDSSTTNAQPLVTKGPLRTLSGVGDQPASQDPAARATAHRVKNVGDQVHATVESELSLIMARQSVFEMGLPQFTTMCRSVLTRCSGSINNGWQQVYTVYYSMTKVIKELRQQPNLPDQARRQRENHIQRFVGPAMQDLGLEAWIQAQGGLKQEFKATDTKVAIV
ncbi:hypothetical protein EMCRGX_G025407 [Ephydatia muelleri]|eukprot:Em0021g242a